MSFYKRAGGGRRDASEPEVILAFETGGASVQQLTGKDVPDLLVGYRGVNHAVEVKTNNAALRPGQRTWRDDWRGEPPVVARNRAQAKKWLRMWDARVPTLQDVNRAAAWRPTHRLVDEMEI